MKIITIKRGDLGAMVIYQRMPATWQRILHPISGVIRPLLVSVYQPLNSESCQHYPGMFDTHWCRPCTADEHRVYYSISNDFNRNRSISERFRTILNDFDFDRLVRSGVYYTLHWHYVCKFFLNKTSNRDMMLVLSLSIRDVSIVFKIYIHI
jgi:hypothetical protein